eukprot:1877329-Amphidinium_carterae.1
MGCISFERAISRGSLPPWQQPCQHGDCTCSRTTALTLHSGPPQPSQSTDKHSIGVGQVNMFASCKLLACSYQTS